MCSTQFLEQKSGITFASVLLMNTVIYGALEEEEEWFARAWTSPVSYFNFKLNSKLAFTGKLMRQHKKQRIIKQAQI